MICAQTRSTFVARESGTAFPDHAPAFVGGAMQTELNKVVTALHEFYAHETFLLEKEAGERALTHRLAVQFERQFPGWEIDCEYDRLGDRTLRLPRGRQRLQGGDRVFRA
jgi:hypothetical protein